MFKRARTLLSWALKSAKETHMNAEHQDYRIPVLCYHSAQISGPGYEQNDHTALEHDLHELARRDYSIVSLDKIADIAGSGSTGPLSGKKLVGISFDDGINLDYHDIERPETGRVESFHGILSRSERWIPMLGSGARGTAFVIASPEAREILDDRCCGGTNLWNDDWWPECAGRGVIDIANHSWDHVHTELPDVRQEDGLKGSFHEITSFDDAEGQIFSAQQFIGQRTSGLNVGIFGYPYGHASRYLKHEYFPRNAERIGIKAAFSTAGHSVAPGCSVWDIPRFVCGCHWNSRSSFAELLDAIEGGRL